MAGIHSIKTKLEQLLDDHTYIAHEEGIVDWWASEFNVYQRMVEKNKGKLEFVFMDGPPFVSGNLHPGHIAVGSAKSAIHIYKNMKGYQCTVKLGYDCHGLPAVNKAAAENGLDTLDKIKAVGLNRFNEMCDQMITKYSKSWTPLIQRLGRHADFNNVYMTRDLKFMETCMWIFKQLWEKGLVYKGNKVMAYSYGNQTPLSNFEASQNYQEKETKSIYVAFQLSESDNVYMIAWTTTPWTLVSNLALCVNAKLDYVKVKIDDDKNHYIVGKNCMYNVFSKKQKIEILETIKGSDLVGLTYKPIFPYTQQIDEKICYSRKYIVVADNYVTESDIGTAIVHQAPAFGEDDFRVCELNGLIDNMTVTHYCPVDSEGKFISDITEFAHMLVFDTEDDIRSILKTKGVLLKTQLYKHNYPYCWRTDTPLIYRTTPSYYIKVTACKDQLVELNKKVSWHPKEVGEHRFHQWLLNVKDWSVSRSTSYATPIMIWTTEDNSDSICVGSIAELEELTGEHITNLHPEYVNHIIINKNGKKYTRIADTFDCWFESGAVPMGQLHYPFDPESKILDTREYLSDFICEGLDQTRGWFYTLMVLSGIIFNKPPYKDVMCTGMILDKDGRKFSKKLGNFVDPMISINQYGADVIRTYFINSPVLSADCLKFNNENIGKLKSRFTPYINGVKFWIEHALNFVKTSKKEINQSSIDFSKYTNLFDRWILLKMNTVVNQITIYMDAYQLSLAVDLLLEFIEDLTNWYIKFNRDRLKGIETEHEWEDSLNVLYYVLITYCRLWAPITPFMSEHIYQHLKNESNVFKNIKSVLLTEYPEPDNQFVDTSDTLESFSLMRRICTLVRTLRTNTSYHTKVVVPLKSCTIYHDNNKELDRLKSIMSLIQGEINCNNFIFESLNDNVSIKVEPDKKAIGLFFRIEANKVITLIESQDNNFMTKVYDGVASFKYVSNTYNEIMDSRFYRLIKTPKQTIVRENFLCKIDNDLMVGIDHTYDMTIHTSYQIKRLHTMIQNARKSMNLRPWNHITVLLDNIYADDTIKNTLQDSLSNADIIIGDLSSDSQYQTDQGLTKTIQQIIYWEKFVWEPFDVSDKNISENEGKLVIFFTHLI